MSTLILNTDFPDLKLAARGKVRDIYDLGDSLLIVTTDRISAFDVIMNEGIPDKGYVLTQISAFWFRQMEDIIPNHIISMMWPISRRNAENMPTSSKDAPCW